MRRVHQLAHFGQRGLVQRRRQSDHESDGPGHARESGVLSAGGSHRPDLARPVSPDPSFPGIGPRTRHPPSVREVGPRTLRTRLGQDSPGTHASSGSSTRSTGPPSSCRRRQVFHRSDHAIPHEGARANGRVVTSADGVSDARVDSPQPDGFGQRHKALNFGRLAIQRQQLARSSECRCHLVHDSARRTDDQVLGHLTQPSRLAPSIVMSNWCATARMAATSRAADELTPFASGTSDRTNRRSPVSISTPHSRPKHQERRPPGTRPRRTRSLAGKIPGLTRSPPSRPSGDLASGHSGAAHLR